MRKARLIHGLFACGALSFASAVSSAQCSPTLEPLGSSNRIQYNGGITAIALAHTLWDPDGTGPRSDELVVAGGFTGIGGADIFNVALYDGARWTGLASPPGNPPTFRSITVFEGTLVGARLSNSGLGNVVRYTGSAWTSVGLLTSDTFAVHSYNGQLFAGTAFAGGIQRWTGSAWQVVGGGLAGGVGNANAMTTFDNKLIVAGSFTSAGGQPALHVASWDGTMLAPFGSNMTTGAVNTLAVIDGVLYAGGSFSVDGVAARIARWTGTNWERVGTTAPPLAVRAITTLDGALFIGTQPPASGGPSTFRLVNNTWVAAPANSGPELLSPSVSGLATYNGELFALGLASMMRGDVETGAAISRWSGDRWGTLFRGPAWPVRGFITFNGQLHAYGEFLTFGDFAARNIARLGPNGWSGVGGGVGASPGSRAGVNAAAVFNNELIIAGSFTNLGAGQGADRVGAWNGTNWRTFPGIPNGITELAVYRGDLYAASVGAGTLSLARYSTQSNSWTPVFANPPAGEIRELFVWNDRLIVAGSFLTNVGGIAVQGIAAYDGVSAAPLGAGLSNGDVTALGVYNGELLAAGGFTRSGTTNLGRIARWDGAAWQPLGAGLDGSATTMLQVGGDLFVTGPFLNAGGAPAARIARWNGAAWHAIGAGLSGLGYVSGNAQQSWGFALAQHDGEVYLGGAFRAVDGQDSPYLARIKPACAADYNCDGVPDFFDYLDFVADFAADAARADFNRDGQIDFFDYLDFVEAFAREC